MSKPVMPKPLPILEYDDAGRYRIVVHSESGACDTSAWVPVNEPVKLGNLYSGGTSDVFPAALFTLREVPHLVLT